ncbi:MAG: ABC transporter ATP-binding protein [Polyangiaceae bacterium]|jgi:ATP-binding cassette subfamily B protein
MRPYRARFTLALVLSVAGQALMALLPLIQKVVVDDAVMSHRRPLAPWLALLVGLGAAAFAMTYLRRFWTAQVSLDVQEDLRRAIHAKINALDIARHNELTMGDVMSRAVGDVTLIQAFLNQLPMVAANGSLVAVATIVMISMSPPLSLVFLLFIPAFLWLAIRFRDQIFPASWNDQRLSGSVAGVVDEAVTGVRVVKAFGQEERELSLLVARSRELFRSRLRTARLTALYSSTLQAIPSLAQLGTLLLGGWLAIRHHLTLGVFLAFSSYLVQLLSPVRLLSGLLAASQQARAGAERVFELLDLEPVVRERRSARPLEDIGGRNAFEHVTFAHGTGVPVLVDVSLEIAPGERVGIVGASGSGKTTLALLLARFYDPLSGVVRVEGADVREYTLESLRRHVGVVFEESYLFSTTIRDNIALGRSDATDAEIEQASRSAQAHDFIAALPGGYSTRVGEHGYTLSGGQRQRIALARAILANPAILVLDDATSAIDARTEESIHRALQRVLRGRTTILIAHRQSTLRLASRVIVLDRGRIVAQGTNEELLAGCPLYRDLLAGPEVAEEADFASAPLAVDPRAWPLDAVRGGAERSASVDATLNLVAAKIAGPGGGGGHRDFGGHRAAFVAATPEILAKVAALPPLADEPAADLAAATATSADLSLGALVRPFRCALWLGAALMVVDAATTLAGPLLTGRAIDAGIVAQNEKALVAYAAAFFVVQVVSWANSRAMQVTTARTAENFLYSLRARTFAHLQRLSLDFYDRETGGRIMTRMTSDIEAFAQLMQQGLLTATVSILTCSGVMAALIVLQPRLASAFVATLPILVLVTVLFLRWSAVAYLRARERIAAVNSDMQETLSGVRATQAWVREEASRLHFANLSQSYRDARLRSMTLIAFYFPFLQLMSVVTKALMLGVGAALIARSRLTAGVLVAFMLYLDQFFAPLQQLSVTFDQWVQARVSLGRIRELLATKTRTPEPDPGVELASLEGDVRFEAVRFAYDQGIEALRGVDLHVRSGEAVALVGSTGAGKSTFVKLVARFYDATGGRVLIDGVPITELSLRRYRTQLGYVPQEAFLFSGTIRSNIAYGRPFASDLEVERAARAVGAHDFIAALPSGYLTPVTERGRSLSAGQKQLLSLARAALVDPAVLILDEATSNLDLATEARVRRAMRNLARGRTTLIIAHRLQTARAADRIVVLEEGLLVEEGPHDHLVAQGGPYARLWAAFAEASLTRRREPSANRAVLGA